MFTKLSFPCKFPFVVGSDSEDNDDKSTTLTLLLMPLLPLLLPLLLLVLLPLLLFTGDGILVAIGRLPTKLGDTARRLGLKYGSNLSSEAIKKILFNSISHLKKKQC